MGQSSHGHCALVALLTAATLAAALVALPVRLFGAGLQEAPLRTVRFAVGMCLPMFLGLFSRPPLAAPGRGGGKAACEGLVGLVLGTAGFHAIAVAFGAPINRQVVETLHWAALMSTLVVVPAACAMGLGREDWVRLFCACEPRGAGEATCCAVGYAATVGSWLGAFPIPLDWDRPWQAWPVSCVYGGAGGFVLGAAGVSAWALEMGLKRRKVE